jgi:hypothetical protein
LGFPTRQRTPPRILSALLRPSRNTARIWAGTPACTWAAAESRRSPEGATHGDPERGHELTRARSRYERVSDAKRGGKRNSLAFRHSRPHRQTAQLASGSRSHRASPSVIGISPDDHCITPTCAESLSFARRFSRGRTTPRESDVRAVRSTIGTASPEWTVR